MDLGNLVIEKLKHEEQDKAAAFCKSIYKELDWDLRFSDGVDNLAEYFSKPREIFLLVKLDDRIIGCGGIKDLDINNGLLKRFYIDKEFRGKGVAALLLDELIKFARQQKYKYLVLDTRFDNIRAQKFYEKHDFKRFKTQPYPSWSESSAPDIFYFYRLEL